MASKHIAVLPIDQGIVNPTKGERPDVESVCQ